MIRDTRTVALLITFLLATCGSSPRASAQKDKPAPAPDQKSEQIINRAIEVLGGGNYLKVRTIIGRGFYSQFRDGLSQTPARFLDYIIYPDKERTEFSGDARVIQTNVGDQGWIFDGAAKTLNDQKPEQIENFKFGLKTSIDTLLRGAWRKEGAKLTYLGRREAGLAKRNETVRLTWPDGFWIEYEFGAQSGLPQRSSIRAPARTPDSEWDSVNRLQRLENSIARLKRRAEQLEGVSNKYWTVRRVIFVCGGLLALVFCKYSGQIAGWSLAASFVALFCVVAVYHRKVRDSITRNSLMLNIKQIQVARIHLDWDRMPLSDQSPDQSSPEAGTSF